MDDHHPLSDSESPRHAIPDSKRIAQLNRADLICDAFERAWLNGERPSLVEYLAKAPLVERGNLERELKAVNNEYARRQTETSDAPTDVVDAATDRSAAEKVDEIPERIGRYRIDKLVGAGAFGRVYLAYDAQLDRHVAIKTPHADSFFKPGHAALYLAEARIIASLEHPNIVPVYDAGRTSECPCYIVSKFVVGADLSTRLNQRPMEQQAAVELVAIVANSLHYAHSKGLVHRDVKPGNILLDTDNKPYVADFGLALSEQDAGECSRHCGTPAYMSPEQAGGEGHRVDARSDIFSLGVVLYEMLVGRRPFNGDSTKSVLKAITVCEPQNLRQCDPSLPKELERICHRAMARRASDRYPSAREFALDLYRFLGRKKIPAGSDVTASANESSASVGSAETTDSALLKVMPRGLRAFDEHDADFFLGLLPGRHDPSGLPDCLRFWKCRIEETDPNKAFSVGLIYGPSGCGKSSLVKAGLLPRLADSIVPIYIESTADATESGLLHALRKRFPTLDSSASLKESLAGVRRGQGMPLGQKLLIILDQFEQWLHINQGDASPELLQALRQCDGIRVQCIVMVRDDFWMATTRFMRELEIQLLNGQNSAAVELSTIPHTEKVLAAFGRAFGALPDDPAETTKEQLQFLKQSAASLAEDGRVNCVRLALFAEIFKGKPWRPATLKRLGGTEGVGVAFLDDKFNAANSNAPYGYHEETARAVLEALLPDAGAYIRGHVKSHDELVDAADCRNRSGDFEDVIRMLDNELRLITPIDRPNAECKHASAEQGRYYQLTHDFLVPSLREWLARKQLESPQGRAALRLAERAAIYQAKPENRHLPALVEFLMIRVHVNPANWTGREKDMMRQATRYHLFRVAWIVGICAALAMTGLATKNAIAARQETLQAERLVEGLMAAEITEVPQIVEKLDLYRHWANPILLQHLNSDDHHKRVRASLAMLPESPSQASYLLDRLLDAEPQEAIVLSKSLAPYRAQHSEGLWKILRSPDSEDACRIRAACALAIFDPTNDAWRGVADDVASILSAVNPTYSYTWMEAFRPVRNSLFPRLATIFADAKRPATERALATDLLSQYAADSPAKLAKLSLIAEPQQFLAIFPKLQLHGATAIESLLAELNATASVTVDAGAPSDDAKVLDEFSDRRRANAFVALARLGESDYVWPQLRHSSDPGVRSWLVHSLAALQMDPEPIIERITEEQDDSVRRALLLALGEYELRFLPKDSRKQLTPILASWYRNDADAGVHAAVEWLARRWDVATPTQQGSASATDAASPPSLLSQLSQFDAELAGKTRHRGWYVNGHGQTMIVIDPPEKLFRMGSPKTEPNRSENETLHDVPLKHRFAIANKEVTVAQYREFFPDFDHLEMRRSPTPDCPVQAIPWYDAALYCNKLSESEGIPEDQWCYRPNEQNAYAEGMRLVPDFLSRTGYRLPTEAEWEYACRAGASCSRYYGESDQLLGHYAWFLDNAQDRTWPGGLKKPNDLGLFDMLGNVYDWCDDEYAPYSTDTDEKPHPTSEVSDRQVRVIRGGTWNYMAPDLRAAYRNTARTIDRYYLLGIRVARTCEPSP